MLSKADETFVIVETLICLLQISHLNSNCLPQVADVRGGHCDIIFLVVKNDRLKIGYKMAHKMKTGHYFFEKSILAQCTCINC